MTPLAKTAAVGFATAAAASVAWVNVNRAPQTGQGRQAASRRAPDDNKMIVCVGSDSVLRAGSGNGCPAGQTPLPLASAAPTSADSTPPSRPNDALGDVERRLAVLQKSPLFTVVDKEDHPMFTVTPDRVVVYYAVGSELGGRSSKTAVPERRHEATATEGASMSVTADGGVLTARTASDALRFSLGVTATRAGAWNERDGLKRLELGKGAIGTYSLKVHAPNGQQVAAIGESRAGTGAMVIGNLEGQTLASMTVADGKGVIGVLNPKGAALLSLTEGASGGGLLAIGDANSTPMVKMGVKDDRYGVVLAGPRAGFPLVPRSGLPGSYFLGCAGGSACKP